MPKAIIAVDLDGTLMRGDSFLSACAAAGAQNIFVFIFKVFAGLAPLKWWMYRSLMNERSLKRIRWNEPLVKWLFEKQKEGAELILVSAAPDYFLEELKKHVGQGKLFAQMIGSTQNENRRGKAKANVLIARFGRKGFDYVGNSQADVPVWRAARIAYNVNPSHGLERSARAAGVSLTRITRNPQHPLMELWDDIKRALKK